MLSNVVSVLSGLIQGRPGRGADTQAGNDRPATTGTRASAGGGETNEPPSATAALEAFLEDDEMSPEEVLATTSLQPEGFLVELVRHQDGRMWQSEIVEETGWSESSVSRRLCALESEDRLQRRQIGRQKLVFLPDAAPQVDHATRGNAPRRRRQSGA